MEEDTQEKLTKKERRALKKEQKEKERSQHERTKSMQKLVLWILGTILIIAGFFFLKRAASAPATNVTPMLTTVSPDDWTKGASESAKLVVEYSDFQCPACKTYHPIVKRLLDEHGDQLTFVHRHFPLQQHKNAEAAARAAEAAGKQGKFWEMHDLLFDNQENWSESTNAKELFTQYAGKLSLKTEQFTADMESDEVKQQVNNDYSSGMRAQINSTPSFFLNGKPIQPKSYDHFVQLVNESQ